MIRVLYILPYDWGGMPHYTAELANAVAKNAQVIVIGSKNIKKDYFSKNVKIIRLFKPLDFSTNNLYKFFYLKNLLGLYSYRKLDIINTLNPDIIHITTPLIPPLTLFLYLYRLDKKYPIIYTKHGIFSGSGLKLMILEELLVNTFERLIDLRRIIVHTENDKKILVNIKKIPERQIAVIPHGAYSLFKPSERTIIEPEKNMILFFGNIRDYKGSEYLLKAVPLIVKEIPNAKVVIAGEGNLSKYMEFMRGYNNSSP